MFEENRNEPLELLAFLVFLVPFVLFLCFGGRLQKAELLVGNNQ